MIARPLPFEEPGLPPRRSGTRAGRGAVPRRRARTRLGRYVAVARILSAVAVLTLGFFLYLGLMANVTRMNYELARNARDRARLVDDTGRLDEVLAHLESRERLAHLASGLGMHDAQNVAVVRLPASGADGTRGIAFLSTLAAWLH